MPTISPIISLSLPELIKKIDSLAVLPHVVFKILELSEEVDTSAAHVESIIVVDPGFSSKVLILANSAAFGLPKQVTSIREAVLYLGYRNLRNVALTAGTYDLFVGKNDRDSLTRRGWWRSSIDAAVGARSLAMATGAAMPEDAYTCGLLHLIGRTLMFKHAGADYGTILKMEELGIPAHLAERQGFGYDHTDVTVAAVKLWGLPKPLQSALSYLTIPEPNDPAGNLRACLALATCLAKRARDNDVALPNWAVDRLTAIAGPLDVILERTCEDIKNTEMHV